MNKNKKTLRSAKTSRRKFITKAAAATGAVVAGGLLAGCEPRKNQAGAGKQETVTLKMQAAWPSGANIFLKWQEIMQKWLIKCQVVHLKLIYSQLVQL